MFGKRRKEREDDYLGPSRGLAGILHRLAMFILLPLRKPLWFLAIVVIAFLAPTFAGVKPAEVHLWYLNKIRQSTSDISDAVSSKTKDVMEKLPEIKLPQTETASSETPKVINMPVKETRRKVFEKATSAPVAVDIMAGRRQTSASKKAAPAPAEKKKLALVYLPEPENISGTAVVLNANELVINGKNLFLYGIYADPHSTLGAEAKIFLQKMIEGKMVDCVIGAYTYQSVATGICTVGEININRTLVDKGYSKNVALDSL